MPPKLWQHCRHVFTKRCIYFLKILLQGSEVSLYINARQRWIAPMCYFGFFTQSCFWGEALGKIKWANSSSRWQMLSVLVIIHLHKSAVLAAHRHQANVKFCGGTTQQCNNHSCLMSVFKKLTLGFYSTSHSFCNAIRGICWEKLASTNRI